MNLLYCDGHVAFTKNTVNLGVWRPSPPAPGAKWCRPMHSEDRSGLCVVSQMLADQGNELSAVMNGYDGPRRRTRDHQP